ncbi:NAD(+) synthase [Granulosicoccus sp. 3-233]|uniref:NAD(+) synthase n=1 Tax=Granulosicoccus sp. 3-233 TaxID=3417969 RepID=UPI003D3443BB
MKGYARIAAAVPAAAVADINANRERTLALWREADLACANVVVFPELGLSGYSIRDLCMNTALLDACEQSLAQLIESGSSLKPVAIVGIPLRFNHGLYNCAALIHNGTLLGVVPKAYLPNYREFEEARWFRPGFDLPEGATITIGKYKAPLGLDLLFKGSLPDLSVGVEICEDLWVQNAPSSYQVSAGATIICNLSASNFTIGKAELRRLLARSASDRGKCAYVYVAAGPGESSTDVAFDADAFICENGNMLAESHRFQRTGQLIVQDIDLELLAYERRSTTTFGDCARENQMPVRTIRFEAEEVAGMVRQVTRTPFLPRDPATLANRCWEMFEIQSNALATRMAAIGKPKLVLGVSGGLDSTHAALVAAAALDLRGQPRTDLRCITLPGFGTSDGTRDNAEALAHALGASFSQVSISDASRTVLEAIGHPASDGVDNVEQLIDKLRSHPEMGDVTLENVQARLRTLLLMTLANQQGGLVVGTGDLSEKALGWSTYAGDHIAMYDVNAGVPKTLIQFVIRWVANERASNWSDSESLRETLFAILDTPISPELLPAGANGEISQLTEEKIGPYELHDFFLYHLVRHGARPGRILDLARVAFNESQYDDDTLKKWLTVFVQRFFTHQFKRSCTADGPKVGNVALSPRGDWRMPSDAKPDTWLADITAWHPSATTVKDSGGRPLY